MSKKVKVVAVSGGLQRPSRTLTLVEALIEALGERASIETRLIELGEVGPKLAGALYPNQLPAEVRDDIAAIESADFLIVASPVYRASFTGLFKHLFDFVDHNALNDVPVLLAATGGSDRHALVIDHQLRPLFSFFQAHTLPIGVYGAEADFQNYRVTNPACRPASPGRRAGRALPAPRAVLARPGWPPPDRIVHPRSDPMSQQNIKFAYWVPNVSGGLVVSKIEQRTSWDIDYNRKLAQIAEKAGFEYALSQIRFTAGYGAEYQHESVAISHALLAATEKLRVIAAMLPGPGIRRCWPSRSPPSTTSPAAAWRSMWCPAGSGRVPRPSASPGWSTTNAIAVRRNSSSAQGHLDPGQLHLQGRLLPLPRLHPQAQAAAAAAPGNLPGRQLAPRATWPPACPTGISPTATPSKASRPRWMTSAPRRPPTATR
jgi:FMN reductase